MSKLVLFLAITAMLSYCLGGINGAIITSVNYFKRDVRDFGSGNAGLTNFSRTFGEEHAALVLVVDIAKTILAVLFGGWLLGHLGLADVGRLFAGFCTIIGHIYPPYYGFQGGKGVLCAGVMALMVDWRVGIICFVIFLAIVLFTRYVSLGSLIGMLCFPLMLLIFGYSGLECLLALFCALLVVFAHRENIKRLMRGEESRISIGSKDRDG